MCGDWVSVADLLVLFVVIVIVVMLKDMGTKTVSMTLTVTGDGQFNVSLCGTMDGDVLDALVLITLVSLSVSSQPSPILGEE